MNFSDCFGDGMQDQEIAAGRDWILSSDPTVVKRLFDEINDGDAQSLRDLGDKPLAVLRSLALIGFHEIAKAAARK